MFYLQNVSKKYNSNYALKNVSLTITEGEKIALIGPNGAGKSTLIKILMSLIDISDGIIERDDISKKDIGFVSIDANLYEDMTVFDCLLFFGRLYFIDEKIISNRINYLSSLLKLNSYLNYYIKDLSTGNKQKVSLMKCLIHEPKIIILDEPTNGLDLIVSNSIRDIIKKEQESGKTTIICSHLIEDIKLSERLIFINNGEIIFDDYTHTIDDLTNNIYKLFLDKVDNTVII